MILNIFDDFANWLITNTRAMVLTIVSLLVALSLVFLLGFITKRSKKNANKRVYTVVKLVESILQYIIFIVLIFVILEIWGVNVTAALICVAVIALVLGLSTLELMKDIISGIAIIIENNYDVDEIVEINGFKGKVIEITLRTTKLINTLGEVRIFRNGCIIAVSNFSRTFSVAVVEINVRYDCDLNQVITLLDEHLPSLKDNYPQIIEGPIVAGIERLNDNNITLKINAKTNCEEHYSVQRALYKEIKEIFDKNNIK